MTHLHTYIVSAPRPAAVPAVGEVRVASAFTSLPFAGIAVLGLAEAQELLGLLVLVLLGLILLLS